MTELKIKGLIGTKLGMTQIFDEKNRVVPVTAIRVDTNLVTRIRETEKDGYNAVQLAYGAVVARRVSKPVTGQFKDAGVTPRKHLAEIRTADVSEYQLGQELKADTFAQGEYVDVTGTTKGKGFAGVMKRHGFHGLSASHGTHRVHRSPGSIGGCSTPGRVFRGLKMAGRDGNLKVTVQNLVVHRVDAEEGVLLVKGAVPGRTGGLVTIRTAVKGGAHA